ncbi:MAG: hypothetical protein FJW34_17535 [Acidobacteria bacterium]|nr:hypothetical protein [Acidobacteriota bacterium]
MRATGRPFFFLSCVVALSLIAVSCTPAPEQPKVGTPVFHWNAAKTTWAASDYSKVSDNLGEVIKTDNEYTAQAMPWRLVLLAGMSVGYSELAETWEAGSFANRANSTPFRTQENAYRRQGGQVALQFAETLQKFEATGKGKPAVMAFGFPTGSAAEIAQAKRVSSGILLPEADVALLEKRVIERAVLLAACRAVGAPDDAAKAQQIFKSDTVQVEWPVLAGALAVALYDQALFFARDHLDRPDRLEFFCKKAQELLKDVPETKETKSLKARIEKTLKTKR